MSGFCPATNSKAITFLIRKGVLREDFVTSAEILIYAYYSMPRYRLIEAKLVLRARGSMSGAIEAALWGKQRSSAVSADKTAGSGGQRRTLTGQRNQNIAVRRCLPQILQSDPSSVRSERRATVPGRP